MVPPKTTLGVPRAAPQWLPAETGTGLQDQGLHPGVMTPQRRVGISVQFLGSASVSLIRFSQARVVPPPSLQKAENRCSKVEPFRCREGPGSFPSLPSPTPPPLAVAYFQRVGLF